MATAAGLTNPFLNDLSGKDTPPKLAGTTEPWKYMRPHETVKPRQYLCPRDTGNELYPPLVKEARAEPSAPPIPEKWEGAVGGLVTGSEAPELYPPPAT